jgi:transcription termination factor Rho
LHLDRRLSERRVFPAFDIVRSGTRREELLLEPETLQRVWTLRRMIDMLRQSGEDPLEPVLERMRRTRNNRVFLDTLSQNI